MSCPICNPRVPEQSRRADEGGFVLITTLLLMVLLLLAGIAATDSAVMELRIAGNDLEYKRSFYRAEGAAMEAAQRLENEQDAEELLPNTSSQRWIQSSATDLTRPDNWEMRNGQPWNFRPASLADGDNNVRLATVHLGTKGSMKTQNESTKIHEYLLFGRSDRGNSRVMIQMRYKKKF